MSTESLRIWGVANTQRAHVCCARSIKGSTARISNFARSARGLVDSARADQGQIVVGSSTPNLRNLRKTLNMPAPLQFDVVFLDHLKPLYTIDLKVMEEEGLVGPVR